MIGPSGPVDAVARDDHLLALLALLASVPPGAATRDALGAALWPELAPAAAAAALGDALDRLRAQLGDDGVVSIGDAVTLDGDVVWCDVRSYRGHLAAGNRLAAAADYQGPFLDRFHLAGAAAFNQWMHSERSEHARAFIDLAAGMAAEAMASDDGQAAARWWTRLVDADPWNPRAALQAMDGFAAMGAHTAAVAVAEEYLTRTGERLGREPDPQVGARLAALRRAPAPSPSRHRAVLAAVVLLGALLLVFMLVRLIAGS